MGGSSNILGVGTTSLLAFQRKLDTISHNIANVNTEGYSRQKTELKTNPPQFLSGSIIGTGVRTAATTRQSDAVLTRVINENTSASSEAATFLDFADRINSLLSDDNTGISKSLESFFESLQSLSLDPSSTPNRQVFFNQIDSLITRFQSIDAQIDAEFLDTNEQTRSVINQLNGYAQNLAQLNVDIVDTGSAGEFTIPNDLLDERDEIIRNMSELVGVSVVEQADNSVNVYYGQGQPLVVGSQATRFQALQNDQDPKKVDIFSVDLTGSINVTASISGGKLGALGRVHSELLESTQNEMGRLAITVASAFNVQHQKGIDLNNDRGGLLFKDVNDGFDITRRSFASARNAGNGVLSVVIDPITRPDSGPYRIDGSASNLITAGTMTAIDAVGDLNINGINIRATVAGDDTLSPITDRLGSAIATANAINDTTGSHGVTAEVAQNALYLGAFTAGDFTAGELVINGSNVVSTGTDTTVLLQDINALTVTTGVEAVLDTNGHVVLVAKDGRNIQLGTDGNANGNFDKFLTNNGGTAANSVQRASVVLKSNVPIAITGSAPGDVGLTAQTVPAVTSSLTTSDYSLSFDGTNYTLTRLDDNVIVAASTNITDMQADGFQIQQASGTIQAGDTFTIRPTRNGAGDLSRAIFDLDKLALASPVFASKNPKNAGTGDIKSSKIRILNNTGSPASTPSVYGNSFDLSKRLNPPIRIEFTSSTTYKVYDVSNGVPGNQIGVEQTFTPNQENEIFPMESVPNNGIGNNAPYAYDPGYRIVLEGEPKEGDEFNIGFNLDAISDNRNALEMLEMQTERLLENGTTTFQQVYISLVSSVGATTNGASINADATESLLEQTVARKKSLVGVNLDEEAAELIRYQQAYQAAAQVINVGKDLFGDLLAAIRR